jgi:hypothetical protein
VQAFMVEIRLSSPLGHVVARSWGTSLHLSIHNWVKSQPLEATCYRLVRLGCESLESHPDPAILFDAAAMSLVLDERATQPPWTSRRGWPPATPGLATPIPMEASSPRADIAI